MSLRGDWVPSTQYQVKDLVFVNNITYICLIDHTSSSNFQNDVNAGKWIVYQGVTQVDLQSYVAMNKTYAPVLGSPVKLKLNPIMASFMYGLNDPRPLDDLERDFSVEFQIKMLGHPKTLELELALEVVMVVQKHIFHLQMVMTALHMALRLEHLVQLVVQVTQMTLKMEKWGYGALAGGRNSWGEADSQLL